MQHLLQANTAGQRTPVNEEALGSGGTEGLRKNEIPSSNGTHSVPFAQPDHNKHLATLKARCALAGVTLIESTDDSDRPVFVVSRWALTKQLDTLEDVDAWLVRVTGKAYGGATQ